VPALRDGAGGGTSLGASLRRHREGSASMVRRAGRGIRGRIQSDFLLQLDAQHGQRHAPGVCIGSARQLDGIGIWPRWVWWRGREALFLRGIWRGVAGSVLAGCAGSRGTDGKNRGLLARRAVVGMTIIKR